MISVTRSIQPRLGASWAGRLRWGLKLVYVAQWIGICRIPIGLIKSAAVPLANGSKKIMRGALRRSRNEGNHFSWWERDAPLPVDNFHQQANAACVRQANDLLSAFNVDAGWDS